MQAGEIYVEIKAENKNFEKSLDSAQKKMENVGRNMQKIGGEMTKYVTLPILGIGTAFAKSAMDLEATEAKYNTVFEGMTAEANAFIKKFQELTPATTSSARSMASGIQDLLVPLGFMREEATGMTSEFMHVTGALTNFNSATHSAEDVARVMQAAITGQYESLKLLGVQLDVSTVKQMAVEQGLADSTEEVTKQHMAMIALDEIYRQSGDALAAYNVDSLDAKTKMGLMKAEAIDVAAQFGTLLLPVINSVIESVRGFTEWLGSLTEEQRETIIQVGAFLAALGPLLIILGKLVTVIAGLPAMLATLKAALLVLSGPVGIVIAAITGLIAAGVLLWKNWDKIAAVARIVWTGVVNTVESAVNGVIGAINAMIRLINKVPGINIPEIGKVSFGSRTTGGAGATSTEGFRGAGVAALATGTNFVPSDMMAMLHKGEAVVPREYNPALGGATQTTIIMLDGREIGRAVAPRIVDTVRVATAIR